jgi:hypothetical protein
VATVNKNFRIKNGLVVEGLTATVNGQSILTETGSDSYIINLIGGQAASTNTTNAIVKRDGSGNFSAGTITANLTGNVTGDLTGNVTGSVTGNVTGDLTGNVTGNVTGDLTGNVTGNVTGNLTGDVTGNVTGTVSSLSNHDTDDLSEGSNLYYTAARAKAEAANLLVNASQTNIVITKDGSNNLTITAENGVADSDTDDLVEGTTNLYFTNTRARQAISGGTGISYDNSTGVVSVDNTIATKSYADQAETDAKNYADSQINALDTDDIEEGSSNLYFTNGRARNAVSGGTGITYNAADGIINVTSGTYDAYGAASQALADANSYTDDAIDALTTSDIAEGTNQYFTDTRARDAVSAGSGLSYDSTTGEFSVDTTVIADQSYVNTAVANLVDLAPAALDTLSELAAAVGNDENFVTTVTTSIGEKVAKAGDTMTGALTLNADPVNNLHAATKQYVDSAETDAVTSANSYTDTVVGNVLDGDTDFQHVDISSVSRQLAGTTGNIATAAATTVVQWHKNDYRSAKILVKAKNGTHTHLSELVLTLDTSDNIALNEYAITTTNGSLMTVDADINNSNVRLRVTPANNNTEVMAHATLLV